MKDAMNQFYLSEEHYWSKYDSQDIPSEVLKIKVISDGKLKLACLQNMLN